MKLGKLAAVSFVVTSLLPGKSAFALEKLPCVITEIGVVKPGEKPPLKEYKVELTNHPWEMGDSYEVKWETDFAIIEARQENGPSFKFDGKFLKQVIMATPKQGALKGITFRANSPMQPMPAVKPKELQTIVDAFEKGNGRYFSYGILCPIPEDEQ